jgi:hypothetical protein
LKIFYGQKVPLFTVNFHLAEELPFSFEELNNRPVKGFAEVLSEEKTWVVADVERTVERLWHRHDEIRQRKIAFEVLEGHVAGKTFSKARCFAAFQGFNQGPGGPLSFEGDERIGKRQNVEKFDAGRA